MYLGKSSDPFFYPNLNIFASKYSPIYEIEVSKAPQSVAPTKACNYDIFYSKDSVNVTVAFIVMTFHATQAAVKQH